MTIYADYESFLFQNLALGYLYEATKNNEFNNKGYIKSIYIYIHNDKTNRCNNRINQAQEILLRQGQGCVLKDVEMVTFFTLGIDPGSGKLKKCPNVSHREKCLRESGKTNEM